MKTTRRTNLKSVGDQRAVSPVIGVILMVAITVILAAVIGTFVLDLGQQASEATPQASLEVDFDVSADNVTIAHTGGDALQATQSKVTIKNESSGNIAVWEVGSSSDTLTVGEEAVFNVSTGAADAPDGWALSSQSGDTDGLANGFQYTVTVIDTKSESIVFQTKFTA